MHPDLKRLPVAPVKQKSLQRQHHGPVAVRLRRQPDQQDRIVPTELQVPPDLFHQHLQQLDQEPF